MEKVLLAVCLTLTSAPAQTSQSSPILAGQVRDGKTVVEGATIRISWIKRQELPPSLVCALEQQPIQEIRTKSGKNGRFRIALPHTGTYAVWAERADKRSAVEFPVRPGAFLNLRLQPTPYLEGVLRDLTEDIVADAEVALAPFSRTAEGLLQHGAPNLPDPVKTDANGRFRLPTWPPHPRRSGFPFRSLRAWTNNSVSEERFYIVDGQTQGKFDLILSRQTTVTFVVALRKLVANAIAWDPETGNKVTSNRWGELTIRGLLTPDLVVHGAGLRRLRFTTDPTQRVGIGAASKVELTTNLRDGNKPLAEHRVLFAIRLSGEEFVPFVTKTDKRGDLRISSLTRYEPLVGFVEFKGKFVQFLAVTPDTRELALDPIQVQGRAISGQVLGADNSPLVGARVLLQAEAKPNPASPRPDLPPVTRITYTDQGGRFAFASVAAGKLDLGVNAGAEGATMITLGAEVNTAATDAAPLAVRLSTQETVTGRVLYPNGSAAAGARVQYVPSGTPWMRGRTLYLRVVADDQGRFRIRGLPAHASFTSYANAARDGAGFWGRLHGDTQSEPLAHELVPHRGPY